jgi:alkyl hydroperoxide reductase subunit F
MIDINLSDLPKEVKKRSLEPDENKIYDVIVIGGGPAGMTAAVYAARKNLSVLLISLDIGGQVLMTSGIHNYMGYQYIMGRELMQKFSEQVNSFPVAIRMPDEVLAIGWEDHIYNVITKFDATYNGKTLIIASGKRPKTLDIPGEEELTGRGVTYCAICDAPLFRNKITAVIGGGNSAIWAALDLSKVANKVYLIVRSKLRAEPVYLDKLNKATNVEKLIGYLPLVIKGENKVSSIVIKNIAENEVSELVVDGIFVEAGLIPNVGFLRELVEINELGEIIVNCNCETSEKGIFACGDVTNVFDKQIIIASGEGAKAALSAYRYLMSKND